MTTCFFLFVFMLSQRSPLAQDEAPGANAPYDNPYGFLLLTRVFNAYPNTNVTAFIAFENEKISRLRYGELAVLNVSLEPHSDYLIQFRQIPTEEVRHELTDFGFAGADIYSDSECILLITRDAVNESPTNDFFSFSTADVGMDSSKLFLFNTVYSKEHHENEIGINYYGLYHRENYDGSESESLTPIALNLQLNEGMESSFEPDRPVDIKGFFSTISTIAEFKTTVPVVEYNEYVSEAGVRQYLLAYGDHGDKTDVTTPKMVLLGLDAATSISCSPTLLVLVITVVLLLRLCL